MRTATSLFDRIPVLPDLDLETEVRLVAQARGGDSDAFVRLAEAYAPRLRAAAARARSVVEDRAEREQAALTAFHAAILATPTGARVATVVKLTMSAEMNRAASEVRRGLSVPHGTARRYFSILSTADGDVGAAAAAAPTHGMSTEAFLAVREAVRGSLSVEALATDEGDGMDGRLAATYAPVSQATTVERHLLARHALGAVTGVEKTVTLLAYGFSEDEPLPDAEIAHRLGINRSSAWKIKQRALTRMRALLAA